MQWLFLPSRISGYIKSTVSIVAYCPKSRKTLIHKAKPSDFNKTKSRPREADLSSLDTALPVTKISTAAIVSIRWERTLFSSHKDYLAGLLMAAKNGRNLVRGKQPVCHGRQRVLRPTLTSQALRSLTRLGRGHRDSGEPGIEPGIFRSKGERVTNYTTPQ